MGYSEGHTGALASIEVPQELLEEMAWRFRVEDASPWNYSMFVLATLVVLLSAFLLRRNIQARRNQKLQTAEKTKQTVELQDTTEARIKDDNSLNMVTETLLSEKPSLAQEETKLTESAVPAAFLPDPQESES
ncbi:organic solute transporter subunit beta [Sorex fumeus]|uniref:organic solute transporter subunit beta n=1 Tax=Sorex fumeus TaxID=62283 RepID=UPI0024ADEC72|nr:organic solute transporter subunit beta [Sorex fumeus]